MTTPERLRKLVADALVESELPRTLIARDAGLGRATLEAWVSGIRNPSTESVSQVAAGLERRVEILQRLISKLHKATSRMK